MIYYVHLTKPWPSAVDIASALLGKARKISEEGNLGDLIDVGVMVPSYEEGAEMASPVHDVLRVMIADSPGLDFEVQEVTVVDRCFGRWAIVARIYT